MLHIDKIKKSSYYTYEHKLNTQVSNEVIPVPKTKSKKNHDNIDEITDILENCILNLECPVTMSIVYSLNTKLFRKMIAEST